MEFEETPFSRRGHIGQKQKMLPGKPHTEKHQNEY
jgi:hypothetical protein